MKVSGRYSSAQRRLVEASATNVVRSASRQRSFDPFSGSAKLFTYATSRRICGREAGERSNSRSEAYCNVRGAEISSSVYQGGVESGTGRPVRILGLVSMRFVIDSRYVRRRPSGIGTCVEALVERLPRLAPEEHFHVWTHPERPDPPAAPNLSHKVVSATADGAGTLLWPARLDSLAEDDVMHFPCGLLGRGVPCATGVTINDLMWLEQPELVDARPFWRRVRQNYYQVGMRRAIERATRIIAISHATADRIVARLPEARGRVRVTQLAVNGAFHVAADKEAAIARAATL